MMDLTEERLPFLDKRGVLYVAPMGTDLPDMTVASDPPGSGQDTRFVMTWPAGWIKPLPYDPDDPDGALTDPRVCSARDHVDTEGIQVDAFGPIRQVVTARTALWDFGREAGARTRRILRSPLSITAQPRMMLGWESEDRTDRVLAPQVLFDEYGLAHLEIRQPPRPPAPRRTWWERLLRRPVRLAPLPDPEPLFRVYSVGTLSRA